MRLPLTVEFPSQNQMNVPPSFFAWGHTDKRVRDVVGLLQDANGNMVGPRTLETFGDWWRLYFEDIPPGPYRLFVADLETGLAQKGYIVDFAILDHKKKRARPVTSGNLSISDLSTPGCQLGQAGQIALVQGTDLNTGSPTITTNPANTFAKDSSGNFQPIIAAQVCQPQGSNGVWCVPFRLSSTIHNNYSVRVQDSAGDADSRDSLIVNEPPPVV